MEGALKAVQKYRNKYMELYIQGQALFAEYNPCESHDDGTCMRTRSDPHYSENPADRCCSRCKFHSADKGCHTISLSCKLWVCSKITSMAFSGQYPRLREFHDKLNALKNRMGELNVYPGCRMSMQESLDILRERIVRYILLERRKEYVANEQWKEEAQVPRYQERRA